MINISFDNPLLLILFVPMLALVLVPYFIAIRKENKSGASTVALVLHILIALLVILAAAGMSNVTVITETELYVLADVSYSMNDKLDLVDEYIAKVEDELPRNSEMGVITFGKNYRLHTPMGGEITSVKSNKVNAGATDIAAAMRYADSLFKDSAIKRIVLITDGMSTDPDEAKQLVRVVEDLKSRGVYVDVMYVDTNLAEDAKEVQISSVDFIGSTYFGKETTADVFIESSYDADVIVTLMKDGEPYLERAVKLTKGYNVVNLELDTENAGVHDYTVAVHTDRDGSTYNNSYGFTQSVSDSLTVLLVTASAKDIDYVKSIYGDKATVEAYVKPADPKPTISNPNPKPSAFTVPFTVEDLCKYDEIIISDVDVRSITSADTFIESLDTVVSVFGKTLITAGNTHIQNQDDDTLSTLEDMLPVKFNDSNSDPKLYTLVIDSSRSMEFRNADYFVMAKLSATYLLGLLNENDYFAIINFSGEVFHLATPQAASQENIAAALNKVSKLEVTQGTMIGAALEAAHNLVVPMSFSEKQIILISDGMSFEGGETLEDDPISEAKKLYANGVSVSTLNTGNDEMDGINTMRAIASAGGGEYYFCQRSSDLESLVLGEVADDVNASEITERTPVNVVKPNDGVLFGTVDIPDVYGYVYAKAKASAETVLSVDYTKPSGTVVQVPLYAYWSYGSGKVATLTTTLGGDWVKEWGDGDGALFLSNVASTNLPDTKNDYPYTITVEFDGKNSHIEIIPASLNPDARVTVTVITPDGGEIKEKLTFDSYRYFYKFETGLSGKYVIRTTYELRTKSYTSQTVYTVPYSPEYDRFAVSSPAPIYAFMRNNGGVFEDGTVELKVDEGRVATYVLYFAVPFLAVAVALYVIDTVIRKLKWADIKSLFKKKAKEVKK